jgi:hypothetical protein
MIFGSFDVNMFPHIQVNNVLASCGHSQLYLVLIAVMRCQPHNYGVSNLIASPRPQIFITLGLRKVSEKVNLPVLCTHSEVAIPEAFHASELRFLRVA